MQHCHCKGPFFHSPWMQFQLQSRALGFDLGNSMVCTYLWKHLPCLFLKPAELEGKVLFFLGSPEKHSFIPLPSMGFNNCPLLSYNILQPSHPWEQGSGVLWQWLWIGKLCLFRNNQWNKGKSLILAEMNGEVPERCPHLLLFYFLLVLCWLWAEAGSLKRGRC